MNRDPRWALSQELEAKQTLLDQFPALAAEDPDFLTDLIDGETNLLEIIASLDASIIDDEILADGAKAALDKLQADAHPHGREPQGHRRRPRTHPGTLAFKADINPLRSDAAPRDALCSDQERAHASRCASRELNS